MALNFSAPLPDEPPPPAPAKPTASSPAPDAPAAAAATAAAEEGDIEVVEIAVRHFLNRLSDYLFVAARFAAHKAGREETVYQKAS